MTSKSSALAYNSFTSLLTYWSGNSYPPAHVTAAASSLSSSASSAASCISSFNSVSLDCSPAGKHSSALPHPTWGYREVLRAQNVLPRPAWGCPGVLQTRSHCSLGQMGVSQVQPAPPHCSSEHRAPHPTVPVLVLVKRLERIGRG
jgi:hypothetical protein